MAFLLQLCKTHRFPVWFQGNHQSQEGSFSTSTVNCWSRRRWELRRGNQIQRCLSSFTPLNQSDFHLFNIGKLQLRLSPTSKDKLLCTKMLTNSCCVYTLAPNNCNNLSPDGIYFPLGHGKSFWAIGPWSFTGHVTLIISVSTGTEVIFWLLFRRWSNLNERCLLKPTFQNKDIGLAVLGGGNPFQITVLLVVCPLLFWMSLSMANVLTISPQLPLC